jgi:hypothetical protein
MKTNTIPNSRPQLVTLAYGALAGVEAHGAGAGLIHHTPAKLRAALEDFVGEAGAADPLRSGGAQHAYSNARGAATEAVAARNAAIETARDFCTLAVAVLKKSLGRKWSAEWALVGFQQHSLAIPARPLPLLGDLTAYFNAHPEKEIPALDLTAAEAKALSDAILAATLADAGARKARNEAKRKRDAAAKRLRQMMVGLRAELAFLIEPNDGRWLAFGFQMPGRGRMPEPVEAVTVESTGSGMALVQWASGSRTAKFRVSWQAQGQERVELPLTTDSPLLLRDLPLGEQITIGISAWNRSGETKPTTVSFLAPS